jgi:hypothetical protein
MTLVADVIAGIRSIKLCAWEDAFEQQVPHVVVGN